MNTKRCRQCHRLKLLSQYRKNRNSTDGYYHICLPCLRTVWHGRLPKGHMNRGATSKKCARCKEVKVMDQFPTSRGTRRHSYCRPCIREHQLECYLRRNYGITPEQYRELLEEQGGVCAICGKPETSRSPGTRKGKAVSGPPRLSVDHDHITNAVRSLLCYRCNHFVGYIERFGMGGVRKILDYLRRHGVS